MNVRSTVEMKRNQLGNGLKSATPHCQRNNVSLGSNKQDFRTCNDTFFKWIVR